MIFLNTFIKMYNFFNYVWFSFTLLIVKPKKKKIFPFLNTFWKPNMTSRKEIVIKNLLPKVFQIEIPYL